VGKVAGRTLGIAGPLCAAFLVLGVIGLVDRRGTLLAAGIAHGFVG
jgi:hypothetical protein